MRNNYMSWHYGSVSDESSVLAYRLFYTAKDEHVAMEIGWNPGGRLFTTLLAPTADGEGVYVTSKTKEILFPSTEPTFTTFYNPAFDLASLLQGDAPSELASCEERVRSSVDQLLSDCVQGVKEQVGYDMSAWVANVMTQHRETIEEEIRLFFSGFHLFYDAAKQHTEVKDFVADVTRKLSPLSLIATAWVDQSKYGEAPAEVRVYLSHYQNRMPYTLMVASQGRSRWKLHLRHLSSFSLFNVSDMGCLVKGGLGVSSKSILLIQPELPHLHLLSQHYETNSRQMHTLFFWEPNHFNRGFLAVKAKPTAKEMRISDVVRRVVPVSLSFYPLPFPFFHRLSLGHDIADAWPLDDMKTVLRQLLIR